MMLQEPSANGCPVGVRVVESWANRNPEQYRWKSAEYDRRLVLYLIDRILLKQDVPFPTPPTSGTLPTMSSDITSSAANKRHQPPTSKNAGNPPFSGT